MEEVVSQEFYHIALFQEHFQILIGGLGACVLIKGRHIVIHYQNHLFTLASLPCPEWIGISVIDRLTFKLIRPFFPKLFAVFHLIPLQARTVYIRTVGHPFKMNDFG